MKITKSTADAVLHELYADKTEQLLKRFEEVKALANAVDAERDRLRKYLQEHVDVGRYGNMILDKEVGTSVMYPNTEGKFALEHGVIVMGIAKPEQTVTASLYTHKLTTDALLHELQKGREHLESYLEAGYLGSGPIADNDRLYQYSTPIKIKITELPT